MSWSGGLRRCCGPSAGGISYRGPAPAVSVTASGLRWAGGATIRFPAALAGWLASSAHRECGGARPAGPHPPAVAGVPGLGYLPGTAAGSAGYPAERQAALRDAFTRLFAGWQRLIGLLIADRPVPDVTIGAALVVRAGVIGSARRRCLHQLRRQIGLAALSGALAAAFSRLGRVRRPRPVTPVASMSAVWAVRTVRGWPRSAGCGPEAATAGLCLARVAGGAQLRAARVGRAGECVRPGGRTG